VILKILRNGSPTIPFLLLSLVVMSAPQAMVLCVGHDGHVAIEPAGHNHCEDDVHACAAGAEADGHSHLGSPRCRPCIDIPVAVGVDDDRVVAPRSRCAPVAVAFLHSMSPMPETLDAPAFAQLSLRSLPFSGSPHCCFILQV
jgi:hypothetical protein